MWRESKGHMFLPTLALALTENINVSNLLIPVTTNAWFLVVSTHFLSSCFETIS